MKKAILSFVLSMALFSVASAQGASVVMLNPNVDSHLDGKVTPLALKSEVPLKATVVSSEKGNAQLMLDDSSLISIAPSSEISLLEYVDEPGDESIAVSMATGSARFVTGEINRKNPKAFVVETPNSTIGIRGTIVSISCDKDSTSVYLTETSGAGVIITNKATGASMELTKPGNIATIAADKIEQAAATPADVKTMVASFNGSLAPSTALASTLNTQNIQSFSNLAAKEIAQNDAINTKTQIIADATQKAQSAEANQAFQAAIMAQQRTAEQTSAQPTSAKPDQPATQPSQPVLLALAERTTQTPAQPTEPAQPAEPSKPTPSEPTKPTEPSQPAEPTEPTKPSQPEPTEPTEPAKPSEPAEPSQPTEPSKPTPSEPAEPSQPAEPTEPEPTPIEPTEPTEPEPIEPEPEKPTPSETTFSASDISGSFNGKGANSTMSFDVALNTAKITNAAFRLDAGAGGSMGNGGKDGSGSISDDKTFEISNFTNTNVNDSNEYEIDGVFDTLNSGQYTLKQDDGDITLDRGVFGAASGLDVKQISGHFEGSGAYSSINFDVGLESAKISNLNFDFNKDGVEFSGQNGVASIQSTGFFTTTVDGADINGNFGSLTSGSYNLSKMINDENMIDSGKFSQVK